MASGSNVTVDLTAVEQLGTRIRAAEIVALGRVAERGYQLLRKEVPYVTGNLKQGVAPPDVDERNLTATLTVSARSGRRDGGDATVHYPSGATKTVSLRPTVSYNYAEVVARGNKDAVLRPRTAKAFLIPVLSAPSGESYITFGSQIFILRRSRKGRKANPYDERAAAQLKKEAPAIVGAVFTEFFNE